MGAIQLPDELQRAIERQVEEGRAESVAAFVQAAVTRLIDELEGDEDELERLVQEGIAAIDAGDYVAVHGEADQYAAREARMAWMDEQLANDS